MPDDAMESSASSARQPLRVLHLTLASDAGGLTRYIVTLGTAMTAAGHEITAAGDVGVWQHEFDAAPFSYLKVPLNHGPFGLARSIRNLRQWLSNHPVDVIHTHYRRATFLARRLAKALPEENRPPILYTLHLSHINVRGWRRWLTDFGDHTHVASQDALEWLEREAGVPSHRITLISHGVDPVRFPRRTDADRLAARQRLGLPPDAAVAAFVGRFDHPKNEGWCASAVARAARHVPNLHLLYCGEGPRASDLHELAVRYQETFSIQVLGQIDPLPIYQAADLLLLPSEREGFSLVCAEAMSVGVPHVRTRTSGTRELTIEDETGVSTYIDRADFEEAVAAALAQPAELRRMGEVAADHVRAHFTFDRQVERTIALYRRLSG